MLNISIIKRSSKNKLGNLLIHILGGGESIKSREKSVICTAALTPVASFTEEVNPRLAKRLLNTNGRLDNRELSSLVKEATCSLRSSLSSMKVLQLEVG